jgi:nicotinate-nucleotide adenylyltransferase
MNTPENNVGLFFGSFNPVHAGHLIIANYIQQFTDLDEVWFILSPHNPHKQKKSLTDPWLRLEMLRLAIHEFRGFRVSDIELYLPQPSYTAVTLAHLQEKHPAHRFSLIMGSDNLATLHKWFNAEAIIRHYRILVYPRPGSEHTPPPEGAEILRVDAPLMEISSSMIRNAIRMGKEIPFFLPERVHAYIHKEHIYR